MRRRESDTADTGSEELFVDAKRQRLSSDDRGIEEVRGILTVICSQQDSCRRLSALVQV
jgi:hypothetical protein